MRRMRGATTAVLTAVALAVITGCAPAERPQPSGAPAPTESGDPASSPVTPAGDPVVLATGLTSPWSIVRLANGSSLVSERNTGDILEYTAAGDIRTVGHVDGAVHSGEGGLLGLAADESGPQPLLYAYLTTADDNRIERMPLTGEPGALALGEAEAILTGLERAGNHNGGRLAFGPDGALYATVGDAGRPDHAQDLGSLNGKILRLNPDGSVPDDNPFPGSLVYSYGHRNPQGLAWDAEGQLWASEFGQNTWDEFNHIEPGANYGWPVVEGIGEREGFVDPVLQWATSEASPSGLAFVRDTFFLAALRGQRLWTIQPGPTPDAEAWFTGEFGRLRDAVPGPDGSLWVLTNNTDGRGAPREGDDRLLQIRLEPLHEG